ncbi:MAG: hypothetical protein JWR73_734 [Tardiphaga sp.]|nr:hypothetical protein [Tardiphaga sp.]
MAEDAFALSPISARASLPSEADYGAIRDAFMETARGRWFLDEYARRNRNADTAQVLDAVARIEAGLGVGASASTPAQPSNDAIRDALLDTIRPLIADARAAVAAAMISSDSTETLAGGRRAARIIREISWSLRETGTDPRICNILDAQLLALDAVHDHAEADMRSAMIGEAFDDLILRVEALASGSGPLQTPPQPEPIERVGANVPAAEPDVGIAPLVEAAPPEPVAQLPEPPVVAAQPAPPVAVAAEEPWSSPTDDELADDDAVLDLIAMEMTAPENADVEECERGDDAIAEVDDLANSIAPDMIAAPMPAPVAMAAAAAEPPPAEASLGAALIASGIVRQPRRESDALAPFRRMSQVEKIAFFS